MCETSMKTSTLLGLWLLVVVLAAGWQGTLADCAVSMKDGLPNPAPLILVPDACPDDLQFKLPSPSGYLNFTTGEKVRLACPGKENYFRTLGSNLQDASVTCEDGVNFKYKNKWWNFSLLECSNLPQASTKKSGNKCHGNKHHVLEVGFKVGASDEFIKVIEVCFDEKSRSTHWSKADVLSAVKLAEPDFTFSGNPDIPKDSFQRLKLNVLYQQKSQLGNNVLGKRLLSDAKNFIYKSQQRAAFNFVNIAPHWSKPRSGLWDLVERCIRSYADSTGKDLVVYTGTHGTTTAPVTENDFYLSSTGTSQQVPVPAVLWKVVYEPVSKRAVVLVFINNPEKNRTAVESDQRYKVCETHRYLSRWYVCASSNQEVGLGYCCEVHDFRNFVTSLPEFEVTGLLS